MEIKKQSSRPLRMLKEIFDVRVLKQLCDIAWWILILSCVLMTVWLAYSLITGTPAPLSIKIGKWNFLFLTKQGNFDFQHMTTANITKNHPFLMMVLIYIVFSFYSALVLSLIYQFRRILVTVIQRHPFDERNIFRLRIIAVCVMLYMPLDYITDIMGLLLTPKSGGGWGEFHAPFLWNAHDCNCASVQGRSTHIEGKRIDNLVSWKKLTIKLKKSVQNENYR